MRQFHLGREITIVVGRLNPGSAQLVRALLRPVAFLPLRDALTEVDRFFRQTGKAIVPLAVREILDEEIARKLA